MKPVNLAALRLRQRDGVTCGPTIAVVAGTLIDPTYRARLLAPDLQAWFAAEQGRVHAEINAVWPRRLGTTPAGMARALTVHSAKRGVVYCWRCFCGSRDALSDVVSALADGWPVAMLLGDRVLPRHWVLLVDATDDVVRCFEPSSGRVMPVDVAAVRGARVTGLGFRRPYAFVLPDGSRPRGLA